MSRVFGTLLLLGLLFSVLLSVVLLMVQWIRSSNEATPTPKKAVVEIFQGWNSELTLVEANGTGTIYIPEIAFASEPDTVTVVAFSGFDTHSSATSG